MGSDRSHNMLSMLDSRRFVCAYTIWSVPVTLRPGQPRGIILLMFRLFWLALWLFGGPSRRSHDRSDSDRRHRLLFQSQAEFRRWRGRETGKPLWGNNYMEPYVRSFIIDYIYFTLLLNWPKATILNDETCCYYFNAKKIHVIIFKTGNTNPPDPCTEIVYEFNISKCIEDFNRQCNMFLVDFKHVNCRI